MFRIASKEQMLDSFREVDREEVELSSEFQFPMVVKDYLSWMEPSGHRAYLVFPNSPSGKALGVVFRRTRGASSDGPAAMCDWCHSVRGRGAVGLMTATVSEHRRVGLTLCRDLSCLDKARAKTPDVNDLRENIDADEKVTRILNRIRTFAHRNLF